MKLDEHVWMNLINTWHHGAKRWVEVSWPNFYMLAVIARQAAEIRTFDFSSSYCFFN